MSSLSRKNIELTLHDIKHPQKGPRAVKKYPKGVSTSTGKPRVRPILVGLVIGIVAAASGYGLYATGAAGGIVESVRGWGSDKQEKAADDLVLSSDVLLQLPGFFGEIKDVVSAIRGVSSGVRDLNSRGLALVFSGTGGDEFLEILKRIHTNLSVLNRIGFNIGDRVPAPAIMGGGNTENFLTDADNLENGLGAIIGFLDVPENRRVILLFENHSEMRPTGGFIGSYGEVVLDKGSIKSIEVNDIYTPDRNVSYKIVPPKQLQTITTGWGARDANWFFDFPTSAEKVLELLETSEMYVHDGVKFDGAVAINANVVSDVLNMIGPIYVPERDVTLTGENFLLAVREEVEEARGEAPKENPKQILGLITPTIIERVQTLDENKKAELVLKLLERVFSKDIQLYFRDEGLQEFIADTPFSGSVYELPEVFNGDYLAVVNANIAGGKSDIFIDQSIALSSEITLGGIARDQLVIERRHFGEGEEHEFYRKDNQNFVKIFTHPETTLSSVTGITPKTIRPRIDYETEGYSVDPVLSAVESTLTALDGLGMDSHVESGKKVFAGWFSTPAGESNRLELHYSREGIFVGSGAKYQFVFDKQSGVESSLSYTVTAPANYIWRESGSPTYFYSADSTPGRLVLNLTLVKQE